jgi:hypothetical protein
MTDMKETLLALLFLITITGFGQKNQIQVSANEKTMGKSFIDSSEIKGLNMFFLKGSTRLFLIQQPDI